MSRVVEFYSNLPKGEVTSPGRGYRARYDGTGWPVLHAIFLILGGGYTLNYIFVYKNHKNHEHH